MPLSVFAFVKRIRRPYLTAFLCGIAVTAIFLWLQYSRLGLVAELRQRLELVAYDLRFVAALTNRAADDVPISIVDIDDTSLQRVGRWPWPRATLAGLVGRLFESGAAVVAFDMVFAEPEENSLKAALDRVIEADPRQARSIETLRSLIAASDGDRLLAESFRQRDVVIGTILHHRDLPSVGRMPAPLTGVTPEHAAAFPEMPRFTGNIPKIQETGVQGGFLTTSPDSDGVIRRTPLLLRHGDRLYPSLAVQAARLLLLLDESEVRVATQQVGGRTLPDALMLGSVRIPLDAAGNLLVPYFGGYASFPYVSAASVLSGEASPELLQNRVVLVGTSAAGLADLKATPVSQALPGIEIHANVIAGILKNRFWQEPVWMDGVNFLVLTLAGLILSATLPAFRALGVVVATVAALMLVGSANLWVWHRHGLALGLAVPSLEIVSLGIVNLLAGYLAETRARDRLKSMFGQYVPPELVERMNQSPESYSNDGETRELTVLFADVRNFTTISESLTAAGLKDLLNRFFTPMTEIIFRHRGTIDKYVGDMVMAFWGAPVEDPRHAVHAVEAAFEMLAAVERLKPEFRALGLPEINIGIGLNTGLMNVGDMGSAFRRAYTVLGDSVNLASRLEGLTKYYGVLLVVGPKTRELANGFLYRRLDLVRVKGKRTAVDVFQPVCRNGEANAAILEELELHERAFAHYLRREWDDAVRLFEDLQRRSANPGLYAMYLERVASLRVEPLPDDWDGVFERRQK